MTIRIDGSMRKIYAGEAVEKPRMSLAYLKRFNTKSVFCQLVSAQKTIVLLGAFRILSST